MITRDKAAIETNALTKRFGSLVAVNDLTLALNPGSVTGFLGPNGAGKSTTLRMLVGLLRPTSGTASLLGQPASTPTARENLGYLPADATFDLRLTGEANLDVLSALRGPRGDVDRADVADCLGLASKDLQRPVKELSSGMRQKLGLVAAMQHKPDVIILDEPANRLDPLVHRAFCDLLRDIASAGRTVLLSSHVLGEVEEVCDQVALIRDGRLIQISDVGAVQRQAQRRVTIRYETPHSPPAALTNAVVDGNTVHGRIPAGRPDLVRDLVADQDITDIEIAAASLEDVFIELYSEATES